MVAVEPVKVIVPWLLSLLYELHDPDWASVAPVQLRLFGTQWATITLLAAIMPSTSWPGVT